MIRRLMTIVGLGGSQPALSLKAKLRDLREHVVAQELMDDASLVSEAAAVIESQRRELRNVQDERDSVVQACRAIAEAVGVNPDQAEIDHVLDTITANRAAADKLHELRQMLAGTYSADTALCRRLACSFGMSTWDPDRLVQRGAALANALRQNKELQQRVRELEVQADDAWDPDGEWD